MMALVARLDMRVGFDTGFGRQFVRRMAHRALPNILGFLLSVRNVGMRVDGNGIGFDANVFRDHIVKTRTVATETLLFGDLCANR